MAVGAVTGRTVKAAAAAALGLALAFPSGARAAEGDAVIDEAQAVQLEALRAEVAGHLQLQAFDLLDELVFGWTQHPLFTTETPLVLADVSVPLGLGSGLQSLIENHFTSLLIKNPSTRLSLVHCPQCTAMIVHSGAKGTVVSRGVDAPEALEQAGWGSGSRHAIFLDFEAEGAALVLRARITKLTPGLQIVFAKTLSSSISSAALLRSEEKLVSAAQARKDYVEALENRAVFVVPLRVAMRSYAVKEGERVSVPPFVFVEAGVEVALTQARAWTAGLSLGYTWAPELHDGWLAQARFGRLISGKARSLTRPDVYLIVGGSVMNVHGSDALLFRNDPLDLTAILAAAVPGGPKPQTTFFAWQLGLEIRVKNRVGATLFLESLPALGDAPAMSSFVDVGIAKFQTIGAEVSFCF
ncbi:MAG: hypothetical protein ACYC8T_22940 [Myxococcaceae bacterium]